MTNSNRVIYCRHKDYSAKKIGIDFGELWDGAPEQKQGSAGSRWSGSIRGRPKLAEQLMPSLRVFSQIEKPRRIQARLQDFREFFRFLDAYETWVDKEGADDFSSAVNGLEDITDYHLILWKTPSPEGNWKQASRGSYISVTHCLRDSIDRIGLPLLRIPAYPHFESKDSDIPSEATGKLLVKALKREVLAIYEHWERSDRLAKAGRNLIGVKRTPGAKGRSTTIKVEGGVTEADLHATYCAAVLANGNLPINRLQFLLLFGYGDGESKWHTPSWWPRHQAGLHAGKIVQFTELQAGFYPNVEQVTIFYLLFLAQTGWNPATADSLDISAEANWCKKYTEKYIWLFAYKPRAQNWQETVAITRQRTGAYQIIKRLMERTDQLRRAIDRDHSLCSNYRIGKRSPWLYQRSSQNDLAPIRVGIETGQQTVVLRQVITAHNLRQENVERRIPPSLVVGHMRDIFAAAAFVNSNFSLFVAQLALGHKTSATTFSYLRRRAWRIESEQKKNQLFVALIDQIEVHRVIDMTLLRAQMDGVKVTPEQIDRLELFRRYYTYSGLACSDPTHPPAHIDPTNPRDGTTPCAQGHLCPGCPKGRVFNDSLPYLGRRCAELEWLRENMPLEVFQDSSLVDQLLILRATLKQWSSKDVANHVEYWASRIASGSHRPIRFSGEY